MVGEREGHEATTEYSKDSTREIWGKYGER